MEFEYIVTHSNTKNTKAATAELHWKVRRRGGMCGAAEAFFIISEEYGRELMVGHKRLRNRKIEMQRPLLLHFSLLWYG